MPKKSTGFGAVSPNHYSHHDLKQKSPDLA